MHLLAFGLVWVASGVTVCAGAVWSLADRVAVTYAASQKTVVLGLVCAPGTDRSGMDRSG